MNASPTSDMNLSLGVDGQQNQLRNLRSRQSGIKAAQCVRATFTVVLVGLCILALLAIIIYLLSSIAENSESSADSSMVGAAASYALALRHQGCKHKGGCTRDCPYAAEDDPRIIIGKQKETIQNIRDELQSMIDVDPDIEAEIGKLDAKNQPAAVSQASACQIVKQDTCRRVENILIKVSDIDKIYGNSNRITTAVVNAKNRVSGLEAAAVINYHAFFSAIVDTSSYVMLQRMMMPSNPGATVKNYDAIITKTIAVRADLEQSNKDIIKLTKDIEDTVTRISSDETKSGDIIHAMAELVKQKAIITELASQYSANFSWIAMQYAAICLKPESFSNDLPNTTTTEKVSSLIDSNDYASATILTALEPEILTNHKKFAKERSSFDSGGGVPAVFDHDNDVVKWVGVFGRPTYRRTDGTSADTGAEPLRSIPSDVPQDMMRKNYPKLTLA